MSIYSGFATRHQQQTYDQCLQAVLFIIQKRLLKFYKGEMADEQKFLTLLQKLHCQMKSMQNHKYLQPKSSNTFQQLIHFLKTRQPNGYENEFNKEQNGQTCTTPIVNNGQKQKQWKLIKKDEDISQEKGLNLDKQMANKSKQKSIDKSRVLQARPTSNHNKIKKRQTSRSYCSYALKGNEADRNNFMVERQGEYPPNQHVQNILNPSAAKMIRVTKKHPKSNHNSSGHAFQSRKSSLRCREKPTEENMEDETQKSRTRDADVRELIKGYINKTKKSYLRGLHKRKEELEQMLNLI